MRPDKEEEPPTDQAMPLTDHLIELRQRLLRCLVILLVFFIVSFYFSDNLLRIVIQPLSDVLLTLDQARERRIIFTDLTESFFTHLKISFFFAFFLSFPIISTQIWMFIAPGLYRNERHVFLPFLIATPIMFVIGAAIAYYIVTPLAIRFLVSFEMGGGEGSLPVELETRIQQYVSLMMLFVMSFGVCFELPVLMVLLARAGIITADDLVAKRRYAIVAVFIAAAVLTPPDPVSQLALALPLIVLYEISIVLARFAERRRREAEDRAREDALRSD